MLYEVITHGELRERLVRFDAAGGGPEGGARTPTEDAAVHAQRAVAVAARITSYNVCYTKLLRPLQVL